MRSIRIERSEISRKGAKTQRDGRSAIVLVAIFLTVSPAFADGPAAAEGKAESTLHLKNGGFVTGDLAPSEDSNVLRWQPVSLVKPFDFALGAVNAVHFPLLAKDARPTAGYCFELSGGDVLFGEFLGLDGDVAQLEVARLGRVAVKRDHIRRIFRWRDGAGLIYLGPNGLGDWRESSADQWREEQGQIFTDQPLAYLQGDFALPPRAAIEFAISWKGKPDFVFALGVDSSKDSIKQAFRFEAWERDLVVVRETEREADVAPVQTIAPKSGSAHLQVYLDQETGRCLVFSPRGEPLADLKIAGGPKALTGLRLENKRGDIRLERLQIGRWNGEPPLKIEGDKSRVHLLDGEIVYGQVKSFDAAAGEFVVQTSKDKQNKDEGKEEVEARVPAEKVASVFLSQSSEEPPRAIAAVYQDAMRLSGDLLKVGPESLHVASPAVAEPLRLPLAELRSLVVLRPEDEKSAPKGIAGILEVDKARLHGRLAAGEGKGDSTCIVWQPHGSSTASPLRAGVSGRIVYREVATPPTPPAAAPQPEAAPAGRRAAAARPARRATPPQPQRPFQPMMHLRTGDTVPCELTGIDEHGVRIKTPLSDSTFVPHKLIKAAEMGYDAEGPIGLTATKRERLLTLPRVQKNNPPTHLIRSKSGDYLRGRITGMDAEKVVVEIHLESTELPRGRIARIIWLHPDELGGEAAADARADAEPQGPNHIRVQALRSDGIRLTFFADKADGESLSGTSEVLGACRVALDKVDQLLIGSAIEQAAAKLAFQQWKLQYAQEPKFMSEDGGNEGTESLLVGKPAPEFELEMLTGGKFRLSGARGKMVVLDFWATWCGPCLQTMPQIDQLRRDFADRDVQIVAINVEEGPEKINPMLERHKLDLPVALDRDGAITARYQVTTFPQTFIIDAEGKVARHFEGGGPRLGEKLAEALRGLLDPQPPGEKPAAEKQPATASP